MRTEALRRWPPPAGDVLIGSAFATLGVLLTLGITGEPEVPIGVAVALTIVHSGALAWRRSAPEAAMVAMGATALAVTAIGWPPVVLGPAVLAGAHGLGAARARDRALPLLGATLVVMAAVVTSGDGDATTVLGNGVAIGVAWWLGDRQRGAHVRSEQAVADAEARARQAVAEERLRIARELHDVVAHALSVIAVQAGTGRVVAERDPATAHAALASIETESRTALAEMRRLLHVLRDDEAAGDGPLAPSPGLGDLGDLVDATARNGLADDLRIDGDPGGNLPAGAELAAYRIVQEALTNVRRHAGASRAEVRVAWRPDAIELEVLDDGRGRQRRNAGGHGLAGMRERAALYGGTFEAGDRPGGGFRVAARLPCGSAP
jgi:signal transduction histidine kinase